MTAGRVTLVQGENDDGEPVTVVHFPDLSFTVDPAMIEYADGRLHIQVPSTIDLPLDAVVIDHWLPATKEEAGLAVEQLDPLAIERVIMLIQRENPGFPWGAIARRAVALVLAGETGISA